MILEYVLSFLIFCFLQALFINGWHECFRGKKVVDEVSGKVYYEGMIFYKIAPKFFERNRFKEWVRPLWGCVKCESSVIGGVTFWLTILPIFGFHLFEIWVWIFDTFILVILNWIIYKRT